MKLIALSIISFLLFGAAASAGDTPKLARGVKIQANGEDINIVVGHLAPYIVDWNGDKKKDLIVGQFSGGKIRLYLNAGTDENPVFKDHKYLDADGKEIALSAG